MFAVGAHNPPIERIKKIKKTKQNKKSNKQIKKQIYLPVWVKDKIIAEKTIAF